jgi:hypothetical protein
MERRQPDDQIIAAAGAIVEVVVRLNAARRD